METLTYQREDIVEQKDGNGRVLALRHSNPTLTPNCKLPPASLLLGNVRMANPYSGPFKNTAGVFMFSQGRVHRRFPSSRYLVMYLSRSSRLPQRSAPYRHIDQRACAFQRAKEPLFRLVIDRYRTREMNTALRVLQDSKCPFGSRPAKAVMFAKKVLLVRFV